jgi:hypothetical protein
VILMGGVSLLQHTGGGVRMRFRARPATSL